MSQQGSPSQGYSPPPPPPSSPQVVRIEAKSGGFWRAVTFVFGLLLFGAVFFAGLSAGVMGGVAAKAADRTVLERTFRDGDRRDRIAILPVEGIILGDRAQFVHKAVDRILEDNTIRAVVLRVDSPGGGVTPSDQIWNQINRLRDAEIPVVASYGGLAASGGYYVSCHADHIVAEETSITGSIGVIAQLFTMEGMMDKVGIEPITLVATDSPEKDIANNIFREWEERDRQRILKHLDSAYGIFFDRVRDGRSHVITDESAMRIVANGSIYTAQEALDNGLVDSIGYIEDAIMHAEDLANLREGRARVIRFTEPPTLFGRPMFAGTRSDGATLGGMDADEARAFVTALTRPQIMYLMP